jgi:hypothetical protein
MASPAHHTVHATGKRWLGIAPDATRVREPMSALIVMLNNAPRNTMAAASRTRSISRWNPTRIRSTAARSGATVFPAAVARAASTFVLIGRFTRSAATATPGHTDRPSRRKAATAIPVGGHRGVTFFSIRASSRLKCAAT